MIRLLFVYRFCGLGGVETSMINKIGALERFGVDASIVMTEFWGEGGRSLAANPRITVGVPVAEIPKHASSFDVVAVADYPAAVARLDEDARGVPVIFESHASVPSALSRYYRSLEHACVAAIVVPTAFNRSLMYEMAKPAAPVHVIPSPLDLALFAPAPSGGAAPVFGLPGDRPVVLWVGRIEEDKNPFELVAIGSRLLETGEPVHFAVVGDAPGQEAYRQQVMAAVPAAWRDHFSFLPHVPYAEMPDVYRLAAATGGCLLSTSNFESAPMIIIEAAACGCPVVASDVGGVAELVSDGVNGCLYQLGDTLGAVTALRSLLGGRTSSRAAVVAAALRTVRERHSPDRVGRAYAAVVSEVAGSSRRDGSRHASVDQIRP